MDQKGSRNQIHKQTKNSKERKKMHNGFIQKNTHLNFTNQRIRLKEFKRKKVYKPRINLKPLMSIDKGFKLTNCSVKKFEAQVSYILKIIGT